MDAMRAVSVMNTNLLGVVVVCRPTGPQTLVKQDLRCSPRSEPRKVTVNVV